MKTIFTAQPELAVISTLNNGPADLNNKVVAQLHQGVAHFSFKKKDGSVREAYGTLNPKLLAAILGPQDEISGEPIPAASDQVMQRYFDLDAENKDGSKGSFRQFVIANLIALF